MTTDYDAPRKAAAADQEDETVSGLQMLRGRRSAATNAELEPFATSYLTGLDALNDDGIGEFVAAGLPRQRDEFTCSSCFLVRHRSRLSVRSSRRQICTDCD